MLSRRPGGGRRRFAAAALLAALSALACDPEREGGVLVLEPGEAVATYPDPGDGEAPALGSLSALAVTEDELYVSDQQAGRVHRFSRDGAHLNALGRKGEGPGELQRPAEVEVGPDGTVWVADPEAGRVTRFRPDGELHSLRRAPYGGSDFGILPDDRMIVPSPSSEHVLAVVAPDGGISEVAAGSRGAATLAETSPRERLGFMAAFLEADPETGAVYFLLNRDEYGLWRLQLDAEAGRIADADAVEWPPWLTDALEERRNAQEQEMEESGLQFVAFNDLDLTPDGLWATTGPIGALGVALPLGDDGRPAVVRPGREDGELDGRFRGVRHARLGPDGLFAVYPTRVRVFALDTVGVRHDPEIP